MTKTLEQAVAEAIAATHYPGLHVSTEGWTLLKAQAAIAAVRAWDEKEGK